MLQLRAWTTIYHMLPKVSGDAQCIKRPGTEHSVKDYLCLKVVFFFCSSFFFSKQEKDHCMHEFAQEQYGTRNWKATGI